MIVDALLRVQRSRAPCFKERSTSTAREMRRLDSGGRGRYGDPNKMEGGW